MHKDRPDGIAISFGKQREIPEDPARTLVPGNHVKALIEERSDTYTLLKAKLPLRLEQLEANKDITFSTDADDLDETASRWRQLLPES